MRHLVDGQSKITVSGYLHYFPFIKQSCLPPFLIVSPVLYYITSISTTTTNTEAPFN